MGLMWPGGECGLFYEVERSLTKEPRRIDVFITKMARSKSSKAKGSAGITDPIGSFFSKYNIISYKGPGSQFSVASFYEAISYVSEFKSGSTYLSHLPDENFHISAFVDQKPVSLFRYLTKQFGWQPDPSLPKGIFYCGYGQFKMQIVVMSQLDPDAYPFLTVLTKHMTDKKWDAFVKRVNSMYQSNQIVDEKTKKALSSLITIALDSNPTFFQKNKRRLNSLKSLMQQVMNEISQEKDDIINQQKVALQEKDKNILQLLVIQARTIMEQQTVSRDEAVDQVQKKVSFSFNRAALLAML